MQILCPHCQTSAEIAAQDSISCPTCGQHLDNSGQERGPGGNSGTTVMGLGAESDTSVATKTEWPARIGRFELLKPLGTGGFGTVYLAHDTKLHRDVALKVGKQGGMSDELRREAASAARLKHPGIVQIYDIGVDEDLGIPFIAMEYVPGSLTDRMRRGRLSHAEAAQVVAEAARALHVAHQFEIVHRDIKPSNLLLDDQGRVRVADFGLAIEEPADDGTDDEVARRRVGTPPYMSPEQIRGDSRNLDRRTDVWSLGVVLYQLLCGRLPFRGAGAVLQEDICQRDPRPPRHADDTFPPELEQIVLRCLGKSPGQRYSTALELAEQLEGWRATAAGAGSPPKPAIPGAGAIGRNWRWALPVIALGVLAIWAPDLTRSPVGSRVFRVGKHDLLDRQPEPLAVPTPAELHDTGYSGVFHAIEHSFASSGNHVALQTLGILPPVRSAELQFEFQASANDSIGGVFFGFRPDPNQEGCWICHAILVESLTHGVTPQTRVSRHALRFNMFQGRLRLVQDLYQATEPTMGGTLAPHIVKVEFADKVVNVYCNGVCLAALSLGNPWVDNEVSCAGTFGLAHCQGVTTIRHADLVIRQR